MQVTQVWSLVGELDHMLPFTHQVMSNSCDPMNCSTPGFPIPHHLLEFSQVHIHWISDVIQPSPSLSQLILCLHSFPASGSFPKSWLFRLAGQRIEASASASALSVSIQGWFPLRVTRSYMLQLINKRERDPACIMKSKIPCAATKMEPNKWK